MNSSQSSQFLNTLSKFLQSICNGYVTFNDKVQVSGYLSVTVDSDQGIDYIVKENINKICENGLDFSSKSFLAQPHIGSSSDTGGYVFSADKTHDSTKTNVAAQSFQITQSSKSSFSCDGTENNKVYSKDDDADCSDLSNAVSTAATGTFQDENTSDRFLCSNETITDIFDITLEHQSNSKSGDGIEAEKLTQYSFNSRLETGLSSNNIGSYDSRGDSNVSESLSSDQNEPEKAHVLYISYTESQKNSSNHQSTPAVTPSNDSFHITVSANSTSSSTPETENSLTGKLHKSNICPRNNSSSSPLNDVTRSKPNETLPLSPYMTTNDLVQSINVDSEAPLPALLIENVSKGNKGLVQNSEISDFRPKLTPSIIVKEEEDSQMHVSISQSFEENSQYRVVKTEKGISPNILKVSTSESLAKMDSDSEIISSSENVELDLITSQSANDICSSVQKDDSGADFCNYLHTRNMTIERLNRDQSSRGYENMKMETEKNLEFLKRCVPCLNKDIVNTGDIILGAVIFVEQLKEKDCKQLVEIEELTKKNIELSSMYESIKLKDKEQTISVIDDNKKNKDLISNNKRKYAYMTEDSNEDDDRSPPVTVGESMSFQESQAQNRNINEMPKTYPVDHIILDSENKLQLPDGWRFEARSSNVGEYGTLVWYISPTNTRCLSYQNIRKYASENNLDLDIEQFIFNVSVLREKGILNKLGDKKSLSSQGPHESTRDDTTNEKHESKKKLNPNHVILDIENKLQLPDGWNFRAKMRNSGMMDGRYDVYYSTPTNTLCRSSRDIKRYASRNNLDLDVKRFTFHNSVLYEKGVLNKSQLKTKTFTCTLCDKAFFNKILLERHTRSVHSNERPYKCGTCGKDFKTKRALHLHELRLNHTSKNNVDSAKSAEAKTMTSVKCTCNGETNNQDHDESFVHLPRVKLELENTFETINMEEQEDASCFQESQNGNTNEKHKTNVEYQMFLDDENKLKLPEGWTVRAKRRTVGVYEGKFDISYTTPTNSICRSYKDILEYISTNKLDLDIERFTFEVSILHKKGILRNRKLYNCNICGKSYKLGRAYHRHKSMHAKQPSETSKIERLNRRNNLPSSTHKNCKSDIAPETVGLTDEFVISTVSVEGKDKKSVKSNAETNSQARKESFVPMKVKEELENSRETIIHTNNLEDSFIETDCAEATLSNYTSCLPNGWRVIARRRKDDSGEGHYDVHYITPTNTLCRSKLDIHRYSTQNELDLDVEQFNFIFSSLHEKGILTELVVDLSNDIKSAVSICESNTAPSNNVSERPKMDIHPDDDGVDKSEDDNPAASSETEKRNRNIRKVKGKVYEQFLRPHSCPVCSKSFSSKAKLKEHKVLCKPKRIKRPQFKCNACGMALKSLYYLKKHKSILHPKHVHYKHQNVGMSPQQFYNNFVNTSGHVNQMVP